MSDRSAACQRKIRHESEESANRALGSMHKAFKSHGHKERGLHVYRCPSCEGWHVGHDVRAMRQIEDIALANIRRQREQAATR